jgi:mono/diheme cytochrome c family protein
MWLRVIVGALGLVPLLSAAPALPRPVRQDAAADPLEIPVEAQNRPNPVTPSADALRVGQFLWRDNCLTCHGTRGKGDGPNARLHEMRKGVAPKDLTDPELQQSLTDGGLFYRVSKGIIDGGEIIMPAYADRIPNETDRWKLVLFVRELGRAARP